MTTPRYFVHGDEMKEGFYCAGCDTEKPPEHFISNFCLSRPGKKTFPPNITSRKLYQMKLEVFHEFHIRDGRTRPDDTKNIHDTHPEIE